MTIQSELTRTAARRFPTPDDVALPRRGAGDHNPSMDAEQAVNWLHEVEGRLYRSNDHPSGIRAWVAVVPTPRSGIGRSKLIIALGSTAAEAAAAAEDQWRAFWSEQGLKN